MRKLFYNGEEYFVHIDSYHNGKPAIILHPDEELYHSPEQIVLSVNLDETESDEVAINDHDYYYGQYQFLIDEGVIQETDKVIQSGFVSYPVGKLLIKQ